MLGVLDEGLGTAHRYSQPQGVSVFGCPDQTKSMIHVAGIYSLSCPLLSSHVDGHSGFSCPYRSLPRAARPDGRELAAKRSEASSRPFSPCERILSSKGG